MHCVRCALQTHVVSIVHGAFACICGSCMVRGISTRILQVGRDIGVQVGVEFMPPA